MAARVDGLFSQLSVALLTVFVNSALLSYALWSAVDHAFISVWLGTTWAVTLGRIALLHAYKRRSQASSAARWARLFLVGAAANGLAWGASAMLLYPSEDTVLQVFMVFVLGGMTAGATASASTFFPAFVAFAVPALTPIILRLFTTGDRVHFAMGVMLTLFGLAMAQIARTSGHRLVDSMRLRFRNEALVSELEAATDRLTELNRDLEARVDERTTDLIAANRVKDEFLAVVSHELRTPLTAVVGWAQMLRTGELSASKRQHAVETIERNALAQAKLIEDLLDLSRVTSRNPNVELVKIEPAAVVDAAIDAIRPAVNAKGLSFDVHIDRSSGRAICGDVARIQQIIGNLLTNAVKFTPQGGRVVLDMQYSESWLEIVVSDTGQGMTPDFVPFAFDRFRQGQTGSTRAHSGLGLGLAISRQLAELHGGTLEAQSEGPGRGATFKLRLPLARSNSLPPSGKEGPETNLSTRSDDLAGIDVLLVDDDPDTREIVGEMIEKAGATAITVPGTNEALAALKRRIPSVIVSDLDMPGPGGDGFALIRAVRFMAPEEGGRIPAIALTAHAGAANRSLAMEAGFQGYMTKPVESDQLLERIASVTRGNDRRS